MRPGPLAVELRQGHAPFARATELRTRYVATIGQVKCELKICGKRPNEDVAIRRDDHSRPSGADFPVGGLNADQ